MSSKLNYLKRYGDKSVKKKKKVTKSNFSIVDDDINWQSTATMNEPDTSDSDEAPVVAEVQDETVVKWQPLSFSAGIEERPSPSNKLEDLSPPRRVQQFSPLRRLQEDSSPPRRVVKAIDKLKVQKCPPRRIPSPPRRDEENSSGKNIPPIKHSLTQPTENRLEHNSAENFTETVYRQRVEQNKTKEEKDYLKNKDSEFIQWGRGVAQIKAAVEKVQDDEYEMSKPLARYADDDDLERMLKERSRDGDPMLMFMKKKEKVIPKKSKKGKPQFEGNSAPNRFGIHPGYRWDGVNRSNGFEKAWLSNANNSKAMAEESYKWSVEDM